MESINLGLGSTEHHIFGLKLLGELLTDIVTIPAPESNSLSTSSKEGPLQMRKMDFPSYNPCILSSSIISDSSS
jgi:hypothetical protein